MWNQPWSMGSASPSAPNTDFYFLSNLNGNADLFGLLARKYTQNSSHINNSFFCRCLILVERDRTIINCLIDVFPFVHAQVYGIEPTESAVLSGGNPGE